MTTLPDVIEDAWQDEAACAESDPALFFAGDERSLERAMALCAVCDVRRECLRSAMELGEMHGVWGGTTEPQRRRRIREERRERRQAEAA